MKVRSSLLSLALGLALSANAHAQAVWTGTVDASFNTLLNWTGAAPTGSDLTFSTTIRPIISVDAPIAVNSLTFKGLYPSYTFSTSNGSLLTIGSGGMTAGLQAGSTVDFAASLPLQLSSSQTWTVDGILRVAGAISSAPSVTTVLTKTGTGSLTLSGNSTFNGGVTVQQGTLLIGSGSTATGGTITSGSLGIGPLTLAANTTFGGTTPGLTLANDVSFASGVTLLSGDKTGAFTGLNLTGHVTAATSDVVVNLSGIGPLIFSGTLDGPANTALRFQSVSTTELDGAALAGTTSANISSLTADHAALYFETAESLPSTVKVQATNGGYVSVLATTLPSVVPASTLLSRIADPVTFAGTFGFDTQPGLGAPHVFSEDLDFTAFTNASFNIGTATEAILTGLIKPPVTSGTAIYRFGGGGGHIFVQSNLTDVIDPVTHATVPAAVVVSTTTGDEAQGVILRGENSFTGTTTTGSVTSNLRVDRAMVVLDSARALPATASFSLGDRAYIGYTEAASFATFADFLNRLAPGGYTANSVFGLDSHAFVEDKATNGDLAKSSAQRVFSGAVDLSALTDGFLGSLTSVRIDGPIVAPSSHILKLTGIGNGRLTITSNLAATTSGSSAATNISSVILGYPAATLADEFGDGEVELTGASTYTGGTKLQSGTLIVGNSSTLSGGLIVSGPIGTGTLTVSTAVGPVILASNSTSGVTLYNAIVLSGPLQLGVFNSDKSSAKSTEVDPNVLILAGNISGTGGIDAYGHSILSGTNTYGGGTYAHKGGLIFSSASSIPIAPVTAALKSDFDGYIGLASVPTSLQLNFIDRFDLANTNGTIGFDTLDTTATVFSDPISLIGFTSTTTRLGSATAAKLTGTITPAGTVYRFGGGGGYLEVASALTGSRDVEVNSSDGASLALRLSGTNTYAGNTVVRNSALIFAAGSLPAVSPFAMDSTGYIGTEDASFDTNFSGFLTHFATNLDRGIIGFDASPTLGSRTITTALDLSYFTGATPNFYIGTSTNLTFGAASSITLPTNATAYRFASYRGGRLQIDTVLSGARGLIIGDPTSLMTQVSPAGVVSSVVLNAANTFTNGTTLYAGNLYLGTSTVGTSTITSGPLGTGTFTVESNQFSTGGLRPTLRPLSAPITLANPIVLNSGLDVASDLTLSGAISGGGWLYKIEPGTLTLSGSNSSWVGGVFINEGNVTFAQNTSAGTGMLALGGQLASTATFTSAAPTIGSLWGDNPLSQLLLAANSVLNISQAGTTEFLGGISGTGASVSIQGFNPLVTNQITFGGANLYTGGTTIGSNVTVIAAHNDALGTTGTVTLNQGTLAVASGITASFNATTHPLVITSGKLSGTGTFAFNSSLDVKGGTTGQIVLSPGLNQPGQLNFNFTSGATLILDSGGNYQWKLMDAKNSTGGWDTIAVTGGVNITATSIAPFNLTISTVNADGSSGLAGNFDVYSSYSWTLLTSTTPITGFDTTKFSIDSTLFLNRTFDGSFSVGLDSAGTSILLNYSAAAIPEPSTWALMITGAAVLAASSLRRRRS